MPARGAYGILASTVSEAAQLQLQGVYPLPPLILHPFTESASTVQVLESARASLSMLRDDDGSAEERDALERQLLEGRFTEFRMLFYVGKDVCRWLDQCVDACSRAEKTLGQSLPRQSFAQLLIEQTPEDVAAKLRSWGVVEYARIFSRSIGIFNQFKEPPPPEMLQSGYLRHYYRYADFAFEAWRDLGKGPKLPQQNFPFTLYASGEYTRMLEEEWKES